MADKGGDDLRALLKRKLPRSLTHSLAAAANYGSRLAAWIDVLGSARGRTNADRLVLGRSALRAPLDMLGGLRDWREPTLIADAEIEVRGLGAFAIRGGSDDLGHVLPGAHVEFFKAIERHLKSGDVAIDAGANIGAVTVFMAKRVAPGGRIIAVEMLPNTAARLRHNIALNDLDAVEVVEQALSDRAGETVLASVADGVFGQASIAAGTNAGRLVRRVEVKTTTLDVITSSIQVIALLKLDLEGAEPKALAGALATLARTSAVIFESWTNGGGETASILRAAGFTTEKIDGRNYIALQERGTWEWTEPELQTRRS